MKRAFYSPIVAACVAFAPLAAGCAPVPEPAQSPKTQPLPPPDQNEEYRVHFPAEPPPATRYIHLAIGDDLAEDCGLVRAHFRFDSADPLPEDKLAVRGVSECLNRPELKGADIEVVGRADSRGGSAYNVELGRKRAEAVKKLLVDSGVDEGRIVTSSEGKSGAVGQENGAYSYGYDRRVDVVVRGTPHQPARH